MSDYVSPLLTAWANGQVSQNIEEYREDLTGNCEDQLLSLYSVHRGEP